MEPGGAAERRTSVTKPIATVNLRQENIIWLETWRPIRTDCKNGTEMTSGDVATFGTPTESANGWKRKMAASYEIFHPQIGDEDCTYASSRWMQPTPMSMPTTWIALTSHTQAMARLPTCIYAPYSNQRFNLEITKRNDNRLSRQRDRERLALIHLNAHRYFSVPSPTERYRYFPRDARFRNGTPTMVSTKKA